MPIEDGRSGTSSQTSGTSAAVAIETAIATGCHPPCSESAASSGRKTNRPLAALADISPIISPRLVLNQRLTMVGAEHCGDRARADARQHAPGGDTGARARS